MSESAKAERINMRISIDALTQLREAARINQQDLTSFVLGAALEKSRSLLVDSNTIYVTEAEAKWLRDFLENQPEPNERLKKFFEDSKALRLKYGVE